MIDISFSSSVKTDYREDLESLLFFNPSQRKYGSGIGKCLKEFGAPGIVTKNDRLCIRVGQIPDVQVLFAFENNQGETSPLIGAIIFYRTDQQNIVVLHIAVRQEYCIRHSHGRMLVTELLKEVRRVAHLMRGVKWITIRYNGARINV